METQASGILNTIIHRAAQLHWFHRCSPGVTPIQACYVMLDDHDITLGAARGLRCPPTKQHVTLVLRGGMDRGGGMCHYLSGGELYDVDPRWHKYHWRAIIITLTWPDFHTTRNDFTKRQRPLVSPQYTQRVICCGSTPEDTIKNWINSTHRVSLHLSVYIA